MSGSRTRARNWHMGLVALQHVESPRPGIKPVSLALAGGFLSTVSPGSPHKLQLYINHFQFHIRVNQALRNESRVLLSDCDRKISL